MKKISLWSILVSLALFGCASKPGPPTPAEPKTEATIYSPTPWFTQQGIASWYGGRWIGRLTANGERYRAGDMTAAHKKLPFNTRVRVTDLKTGKQVIVRINNRGPFIKGRIIDLSVVAAKQLGTYDRGLAKVKIEALREIPQIKKPNLSKPKTTPTPGPTPSPKPTPKARATTSLTPSPTANPSTPTTPPPSKRPTKPIPKGRR
ncbi:MAG: septal ring lytic transglycosylase RlpA family protein [Terrimicrobiaceae bacterium]